MSLTSTDLHGDLYGHLQVGPMSLIGAFHLIHMPMNALLLKP
jgi:hypothetical protein